MCAHRAQIGTGADSPLGSIHAEFVGALIAAASLALAAMGGQAHAAITIFSNQAAFDQAYGPIPTTFFPAPSGEYFQTSGSYVLNNATFVSSAGQFSVDDGAYGSDQVYLDSNGTTQVTTVSHILGLNLGSYSVPRLVSFTANGVSSSVSLPANPNTTFLGFSDDSGPLNIRLRMATNST